MILTQTRRYCLGAMLGAAALAIGGAGYGEGARDMDAALIQEARRGDVGLVARLLGDGALVNAREATNRMALHFAVEGNHIVAAEALIEAGTELDHVNRLGWTALPEAIIVSDAGPAHREIVRMPLEAGAVPALATATLATVTG